MKKFSISEGYLISSNREEKQKIEGKEISVIPAYKFLLKEF
jgi:predicted AAA+ superfamily ATPase